MITCMHTYTYAYTYTYTYAYIDVCPFTYTFFFFSKLNCGVSCRCQTYQVPLSIEDKITCRLINAASALINSS